MQLCRSLLFVLASLVGLLPRASQAVDAVEAKNAIAEWRQANVLRPTGPFRNVTVVVDTSRTNPLQWPSADGSEIDVFPAHSWILFEGTDANGAMRVEVVRPVLNGKPLAPALAMTVYPVGATVDDAWFHETTPPDTDRTFARQVDSTKFSNPQLFDPMYASGGTRPSVVRKVWTANAVYHDRKQAKDSEAFDRFWFASSCRFVRVFFTSSSGVRFNLPREDSRRTTALNDALIAGDRWTRLQRDETLRLAEHAGHALEQEKIDFLVYETGAAPASAQQQQKQQQSASKMRVVFALDKSAYQEDYLGPGFYGARQVEEAAWLRSLCSACASTANARKIRLSRDPVLTSDMLDSDARAVPKKGWREKIAGAWSQLGERERRR